MTEHRPPPQQVPPEADLSDTFEATFQAAQSLFLAGWTQAARTLCAQLREGLLRIGPDLAARRSARLDRLCPPPAEAVPAAIAISLPTGLDPSDPGLPGTTLVTATRNRTDNLLAVLPSWLAQSGIDQIVIVDWSSDIPVSASLAAAGIGDPRLTLARVDHEPAWVLTWAFNLGFRLARHARILKADADIRLAPDFFAANPLGRGRFIAGNWRTAPPGQAHINGAFHCHRADLAAVQGFNEYLTRYGWDDDDLYDRLGRAGLARHDLAPGSVHHLDHDDTARLAPARDGPETGWSDLRTLPLYGIRTNRLIATLMPDWTQSRRMQPFGTTNDQTRNQLADQPAIQPGNRTGTPSAQTPVTPSPATAPLTCLRLGPAPHPVPGPMQRSAARLAAREMLSWQAGPRALELEDDDLDLLLSARRLAGTGALHVALMLAGAPLDAVAAPRHLVADLDTAALQARPEAAILLKQSLIAAAEASGRSLVLRSPDAPAPPLADLPRVPHDTPLGAATETRAEAVADHPASAVLRLTAGLGPQRASPPPAARIARTGPGRLFIDAQHGLGNRLRAIGSAAAIARATGRELVVIWQPDDHCRGQLLDLFDYTGAVLTAGFWPEAAARGATLLNYMETEPGAAKGAPLHLTEGQDAYLRSAYVIAHPASTWAADVAFLRALAPSARVLALLQTQAGTAPPIGVHIRSQGAPGTALQPCDAPENWLPESHATIQAWRGRSHPDRFIARLRSLFAADPQAHAFVAADTPEGYGALQAAFGDRIARLERNLYDRSADQLPYALADALLLARSRHFLGSPWSSFSELVLRLGPGIATHETAGQAF